MRSAPSPRRRLLTGCGDAGSSGTEAPASTAPGAGLRAGRRRRSWSSCTDDKKLQNTDNIIPAVNAKAANPQLIAALDKVSAALDTPKLIAAQQGRRRRPQDPQGGGRGVRRGQQPDRRHRQGPGRRDQVGAANFSESQTLGELYRIALTAAGYQVKVQQIGNRELYEPALEKGEIQVVPEYAATMAEFLNTKANGANAQPVSSPDLDKTVTGLKTVGDKGASASARRPPRRTRTPSRSPRPSPTSTA